MKKNKPQTKKCNIPRIIKLTPEQQSKLTAALIASNLDEDFRKLVIGMVDGNRWLSDSLEKGQLTTYKLRKLFGLPTEKAVNRKSLVDIANQSGSEFDNIINTAIENTSNPINGIQAAQNNKPQFKSQRTWLHRL